MTDAHRARLRHIMGSAWGLFREAKRDCRTRAFADCLRGAWRMIKRVEEAAAAMFGGRKHVRLSRDIIRSPLARTLGAGSQADFRAAYLTARLGG